MSIIITDDNKSPSEVSTSFKHDIIKDVLKTKFANPKNKITDDAIELVSEILKVMVIEAALRAAKQSSVESRTTITLEHVETILPQLIDLNIRKMDADNEISKCILCNEEILH